MKKALPQRFHSFLSVIINILIPPRKSERIVDALSYDTIAEIQRAYSTYHHDAFALLPYRQKEIAALIWELKYHRSTRALSLLVPIISEEILGLLQEELAPPLLIPIPMHAARKKERGHNQAETVCRYVAEELGGFVLYTPQALMRTRETPTQQGLPREKRLHNVRNSMRSAPTVRGRTCIILDDVITTGATFAEARRALSAAGAEKIYCVALAG